MLVADDADLSNKCHNVTISASEERRSFSVADEPANFPELTFNNSIFCENPTTKVANLNSVLFDCQPDFLVEEKVEGREKKEIYTTTIWKDKPIR